LNACLGLVENAATELDHSVFSHIYAVMRIEAP
jgi:hypothetical protein